MEQGNIVGIDPHRRTLTATVLDERGVAVGHDHFDNTNAGYRALTGWVDRFGPVQRWGVEGASGLGRHLAGWLVNAGHDVRDVPPHRIATRGHGRNEGKSDLIDSHRVARETQTNPRLACAFKNATPGPADTRRERMALWHNARRSLTKIRVQLLGEIDMLIGDLPEPIRIQVATAKSTRAKINAFNKLDRATLDTNDSVLQLRLELLIARISMLRDVLDQDRQATKELTVLVDGSGSTLTDLVGIAPRAAAEILIAVGDIRRFTEGGFARYNGTAPIPASSGEGPDAPVRHRLSRGGNRQLNAVLHRMAMIQLRFEPRARTIHDNARVSGHTKREAMRILKRHLSNVVYRTMARDAAVPDLT